ncbi:MAG: flagellar basal-body rod protein FlgG [Planctomycetota bacterium]|jgi:flagellar basal-body rod protein FlgG
MSSLALNTSASGMSALNTQLDITANNLANANTTAFKSSRANFQDLYYIEKKQPGVENQIADSTSPIGLFVGLGVEVAGTQLDFEQGPAIATGRPLDVMIEGKGFLQIDVGDVGEGIAYTRDGALLVDEEGSLVLANNTGYRVEGGIVIPPDSKAVTIGSDGSVYYQDPNQNEPVLAGQLELAYFQNNAGLETIGQNLYLETYASGPVQTGDPGTDGLGRITSGYLEGSNVDPVTQLVDLIRTQRTFEMNSQALQAADETLRTVVNIAN